VPRQVSATARRYGIARSQLLRWRRLFRSARNEAVEETVGFVPAVVVPESGLARSATTGSPAEGTIEIEFASGARMRVMGAIDAAALKAAVEALTGRKQR
jgi:transposase